MDAIVPVVALLALAANIALLVWYRIRDRRDAAISRYHELRAEMDRVHAAILNAEATGDAAGWKRLQREFTRLDRELQKVKKEMRRWTR